MVPVLISDESGAPIKTKLKRYIYYYTYASVFEYAVIPVLMNALANKNFFCCFLDLTNENRFEQLTNVLLDARPNIMQLNFWGASEFHFNYQRFWITNVIPQGIIFVNQGMTVHIFTYLLTHICNCKFACFF